MATPQLRQFTIQPDAVEKDARNRRGESWNCAGREYADLTPSFMRGGNPHWLATGLVQVRAG
jgi:hypothetical protein